VPPATVLGLLGPNSGKTTAVGSSLDPAARRYGDGARHRRRGYPQSVRPHRLAGPVRGRRGAHRPENLRLVETLSHPTPRRGAGRAARRFGLTGNRPVTQDLSGGMRPPPRPPRHSAPAAGALFRRATTGLGPASPARPVAGHQTSSPTAPRCCSTRYLREADRLADQHRRHRPAW
jgi:hypothetical protein